MNKTISSFSNSTYAALLSEFLAFITYLASKNYGPQLQPAD